MDKLTIPLEDLAQSNVKFTMDPSDGSLIIAKVEIKGAELFKNHYLIAPRDGSLIARVVRRDRYPNGEAGFDVDFLKGTMVFGLEQRRIFGTNKLLDKYTVFNKPQDFGSVHKDEVPIQSYLTFVNEIGECLANRLY